MAYGLRSLFWSRWRSPVPKRSLLHLMTIIWSNSYPFKFPLKVENINFIPENNRSTLTWVAGATWTIVASWNKWGSEYFIEFQNCIKDTSFGIFAFYRRNVFSFGLMSSNSCVFFICCSYMYSDLSVYMKSSSSSSWCSASNCIPL